MPPPLKLPRFVLVHVTVAPGKMFALLGTSVTMAVQVLGALTSKPGEHEKLVELPNWVEETEYEPALPK